MDRIFLESTILAWVRYLPDLHLLQVGLRTGQDYEYFAVPVRTYAELLASQSKGRYYNFHIRNEFRFRQISKTSAS